MTRDALAKRIARKLKHWEGSQLNTKTAREIIDVIEKAVGKLNLKKNSKSNKEKYNG